MPEIVPKRSGNSDDVGAVDVSMHQVDTVPSGQLQAQVRVLASSGPQTEDRTHPALQQVYLELMFKLIKIVTCTR